MISFFVTGTPGSKGSHRAFNIGGRAIVVPGGSSAQAKTQKAWEAAVRDAAQGAVPQLTALPAYIQMPVEVEIRFYFRRPKAHYNKKGLKHDAPQFVTVKPDLDKAIRCTADALIGVIYDDDSRISRLIVEKVYANNGKEGAHIIVRPCVEGGIVREITAKEWADS